MGIRAVLGREASGEELMVIGFGMCAYGMWARLYWFELGGFMLFFAGVLTLKPVKDETEEEGGLQGDGGDSENPLGRPPIL